MGNFVCKQNKIKKSTDVFCQNCNCIYTIINIGMNCNMYCALLFYPQKQHKILKYYFNSNNIKNIHCCDCQMFTLSNKYNHCCKCRINYENIHDHCCNCEKIYTKKDYHCSNHMTHNISYNSTSCLLCSKSALL